MMESTYLIDLAVSFALLPVAALGYTRRVDGIVFMGMLLASTIASASWGLARIAPVWETDFSTSLWVTMGVTGVLYSALCIFETSARRLSFVLMPYLFVMGVIATIFESGTSTVLADSRQDAWFFAHVASALATYGAATVAAAAAVSVSMQEHAIKHREPTAFSMRLPSVTEAEEISLKMLLISAAALVIGLATGMAENFVKHGTLLTLSHKVVLSGLALAVILLLIFLQHRTGMRGRRAARVLLAAYLLMTLGYPGVKFVTDFLIR